MGFPGHGQLKAAEIVMTAFSSVCLALGSVYIRPISTPQAVYGNPLRVGPWWSDVEEEDCQHNTCIVSRQDGRRVLWIVWMESLISCSIL